MAKKAAKSKVVTKETIMLAFTKYVIDNGSIPDSESDFCQAIKIKEADFYNKFASLHAVRKSIWKAFHQNTISVLHNNQDYVSYPIRDKMLSYYYTFFEVLNLNRDYVMIALEGLEVKNVLLGDKQFKSIKKRIMAFSSQLIEESNESKQIKTPKYMRLVFAEGAWMQFLFILKYWMQDASPEFQKTDVVIEKSINTAFDVLDTKALESVVDLGKFLWKEKMM